MCFSTDDDNDIIKKDVEDYKLKVHTIERRQDAPKVWEFNGSIYVINSTRLKEVGLSKLNRIRKYVMDDLHSIDIDSMFDRYMAEKVISSHLIERILYELLSYYSPIFSIIDAIRCINEIHNEPLVLFVVDENKRMQGTLTDGDVRRALIKGIDVDAPISEAMHRNFNFLRRGVNDRVEDIHHQRDLRMRLVPILDEENHICEIINLEHYVTKLPIDAVLMAGGKGNAFVR